MTLSKETINKIISGYVVAYPGQLSAATASITANAWYVALRDLDDADVKAASLLVMHQLSRFPTPADVRNAVHTIQSVRAIEARHAEKQPTEA